MNINKYLRNIPYAFHDFKIHFNLINYTLIPNVIIQNVIKKLHAKYFVVAVSEKLTDYHKLNELYLDLANYTVDIKALMFILKMECTNI